MITVSVTSYLLFTSPTTILKNILCFEIIFQRKHNATLEFFKPMPLIRSQNKETLKQKMGYQKKLRGCVCCKQPYHGRLPVEEIVPEDDSGSFTDKGFYELLQHFQHQPIHSRTTSRRLEPSVAKQVAHFAKARAREIAKHQDPNERRAQKRNLAPFELDEVELGQLLGVGGFSYVFEVRSFDTESTSSSSLSFTNCGVSGEKSSSGSFSVGNLRPYDKDQRKAREFLSHYVMRSQGDSGKSTKEQRSTEESLLARYAIKHLRPSLLETPGLFAKAAMDLACEAQMLMSLDHPNIIKLRGWSANGTGGYMEGKHNSYFLIVDRLLETLEERISKWRKEWKLKHSRSIRNVLMSCIPGKKNPRDLVLLNGKISEDDSLLAQRVKVAYDMACALEYLHEKRIVYRDLKSSNVGFDVRGDVKLIDFGLSRYLPAAKDGADECFRMSNVGTRRYTAPEVTAKEPYNLKADIYSFGVCLWEILMMSTPRLGKSKRDFDRRAFLAPCPCWPPVLQKLVVSMMAPSFGDRPTATHVRTALEGVLLGLSNPDVSAELLVDARTSRRRRSTFRLECCNLADFGMKDSIDEDLNIHSHTSIATSFADQP